ncbi:hypothetical protein EJB05_26744, partial [Eragrostis curvula]
MKALAVVNAKSGQGASFVFPVDPKRDVLGCRSIECSRPSFSATTEDGNRAFYRLCYPRRGRSGGARGETAAITQCKITLADMVEYMKKLARMDVDMSAEERHLFSVGFKNTIGARRASWRILSSLEQKVTAGDQTGVMIDAYKRKIEDELRMVCNEILSIIAIHCLPLATSGEHAVFFYKMKGDYYRYLAEFSTGNEKKAAADQALMAYQHAMVVASSELSPAHQIRLGVALNFSVFFYEILNSHERSCILNGSFLPFNRCS